MLNLWKTENSVPSSRMKSGGEVRTDFFEELTLLNDIRDGLLLDALRLVDILEGKELLRLFMFHNPDLNLHNELLDTR